MSTERYSRQKDIVPMERIESCKATVIGVGAIGRQVALQLAAIGIPWLELIDFDTVEESNIASQGYLQSDLGKAKVEATGQLCRQINPDLKLHISLERFKRSMKVGNVVFCCVDSIQTRKLIWDTVKDRCGFFADGRMTAEVLRVLTASDDKSREHYPTTLFSEEEAFAGSCTARQLFTAPTSQRD